MSAYFVSSRGLASRMLPRGTLSPIAQELFGAYEQGAMYDPEITGSLFQDSAFTVPVTAVEQPVGGMLDLSGRGNHAFMATTTKRSIYSRRVNLLVSSEDITNAVWTLFNGGTKTSATRFTFSATAHSQTTQTVTAPIAAGTTVQLKVKIAGTGTCSLVIGRAGGGTYEDAILPVTLVPDGAVITLAKTFLNAHTGATISISRGASGTAAYVDILETDLRLAADAHLPYQRINTATDYDADPSKFPAYLRFEVDDALQTGNIDFTGTDKMTVWAGITKLSDAATGMMLESSVNSNSNSGSFFLTAPDTPGTGSFSFKSRGSLSPTPVPLYGNAAPLSRVVVALGDIGGDIATIRAGGTSTTSTADQGTGNYGNYPLYIGSRAGTSIYFNGRLYSLIVRGAQSSLSQIEATEAYIKQKMRLP